MKNLEQHEKMHREVETLGNAGNYHGQAQAFLAGTGTVIEAQFLNMNLGFFSPSDKEPRDIWNIRMTRNGRVYIFTYGDSIKDTEERLERIAGAQRSYSGISMRHGRMDHAMPARIKKWETLAKEWTRLDTKAAASIYAPSAYSILAGLTTTEPPNEVDEFASEYGITSISEAVRTHKTVLEEYAQLRALFDNDELETLQLIS